MENKYSRIIKELFICSLIIIFVYLIAGEFVRPSDRWDNDYVEDVSETWEWYQIENDGSRRLMKNVYDVVPGEVLTIETRLPDQIRPGCYLGSRASCQAVTVYVGDELRGIFDTGINALFGANRASGYYNVGINEYDAGKIVRVIIESDNHFYSGHVNSFLSGSERGIWMEYVARYKLSMALTVFLAAFSVLAIIVGIVIERKYRSRITFVTLSVAIMDCALFMICNSMLRQILFSSISVAADVTVFCWSTLMIPFIFYLEQIQEYRHEKIYRVVLSVAMGASLLCNLSYISGLTDIVYSSQIGSALILLQILFCCVMVVWEMKDGKAKEYKANAVAFLALAPVFAMEIVNVYLLLRVDFTSLFCLMLILLLCLDIYGEIRKVSQMRNEVREATNASRSKSAFLANMSHEIRTPINGILGMNEMILRETDDEGVKSYAEDIRSAGRHLLGIINDILDFSKIESGKMEIIPSEYSVSSMVSDITAILKERGEEKGLRVNLLISPKLPSRLKGDELRVKQIALNIVSNAVKYTDEGSIALAISGTEQDDSYLLKIVVKDTGIGIREEELDKLFEKFMRIDEKHNATIEGTGLGMSITKNLVDAMNGTINVESTFGKGSTFTVEIPQQIIDNTAIGNYQTTAEKEHVEENRSTKRFIAPDAKVLVVDDVSINRSVIKGLLKKTQIQVATAGSGPEALNMCNREKYDLILMDHKMPDMDGVETFHFLRNNKGINQNTHVLVLTANAIAGMKEQYIKEGFDDYLSKPVEPALLEEMLLKYLPILKIEYIREEK